MEVDLFDRLEVITGATGLLGSHIAEQLAANGSRVRAFVRPDSETTFLRQLGAEVVTGDLQDPAALRSAFAGAGVVYHCAARVSDWGPWADFQRDTIDATANVLEAAKAEGVSRVLYVSSVSVYGRPAQSGELSEETPLGQRPWAWDSYGRSKLLAEEVARKYGGLVTIVRPSWCYGERDGTTIPRVVRALREGRVPIIGKGDNLLNIIYAGDVAAGAILAAHRPEAGGQAYNLSSEGEVTQQKLVDTLSDALGLPRVTKHVPYGIAFRWAFVLEAMYRTLRRRNPPTITRRAVYLVGRPTCFSTRKAREQLGWKPRVGIEEGVRRTLDWFLAAEAKAGQGQEPSPAAR